MNDEQKDTVTGVIDTYVNEYLGDIWQDILAECTESDEEFEWAYDNVYMTIKHEA